MDIYEYFQLCLLENRPCFVHAGKSDGSYILVTGIDGGVVEYTRYSKGSTEVQSCTKAFFDAPIWRTLSPY